MLGGIRLQGSRNWDKLALAVAVSALSQYKTPACPTPCAAPRVPLLPSGHPGTAQDTASASSPCGSHTSSTHHRDTRTALAHILVMPCYFSLLKGK